MRQNAGKADLLERMAAELRAWLPTQRWYAGKASPIVDIVIADWMRLDPAPGGAPTENDAAANGLTAQLLLLADVTNAGGAVARYQIPVRFEDGVLTLDGLTQPDARRRWFELLLASAPVRARQGTLAFERYAAHLAAAGSRLGGAEQSNTSIFYQDESGAARWVLKLFRRLMPGNNPEFEIPRALAAFTGFRNTPAPAARALYCAGSEVYTLATLQPFIPNQGDGWEYVLRCLQAAAADATPSPLLAQVELLGRRTAELHLALASISESAFVPEPITPADAEHWRRRALEGARAQILAAHRDALAPWIERVESGRTGLEAAMACNRIRIHADYHLGQVLRTADDFYIFDFEGEPTRPLAERRRKGCVLQDVAGMLRSFGYAAHTARRPDWEPAARTAFLASYRRMIANSTTPLAPAGDAEFSAALSFFECEKAVYELAYEVAHRPDWIGVPLTAVGRLFSA